METNNQLQEIFIWPTGLKLIIYLDDNPLYSSEKVNEKLLKAFSKSSKTKSVINQLTRLVNQKKIIPCFYTKSFPGFIAWKIFSPTGIKEMAAFYTPQYNQIYLLLAPSTNMFGYINNNFIAELITHELCHMYANSYSSFPETFSNILGPFYQHLYSIMFSIPTNKLPMSIVMSLITDLYKNVEVTATYSSSMMKSWLINVDKILRPLSTNPNIFDEIIPLYLSATNLYYTDLKTFILVKEKYKSVLDPIYLAYKRSLKMSNLTTLAVQELFIPSEVVAIYSEHDSNVINKIL